VNRKIYYTTCLLALLIASPFLNGESAPENLQNTIFGSLSNEAQELNVTLPDCVYEIYNDTGIIYVKNGTTGEVEFSGDDAATVFQQAIDSFGGGRILVRDGLYNFHKAITPEDNLILEGESWNATLRMANNFTSGNQLGIITDAAPGHRNLELRNLRFDGNRENQYKTIFCIDIGYTQNLLIHGCLFEKAYWHGCRVDFSDRARFRNNLFLNNGQHGLAYRYSENGLIVGNVAERNIGCGYSIGGASGTVRNVVIRDNLAFNNTEDGIHLESGIESTIVKDNLVLNNKRDGIRLTAAMNCTIDNNVVEGCGTRGMYLKNMGGSITGWPLSRIVISNNRVSSSRFEGIFIEARYSKTPMEEISLINNYVGDSGRTGLKINGTMSSLQGLSIIGGVYNNTKNDCIQLIEVDDILMSDVLVCSGDPENNGVTLEYCNRVLIVGSSFTGCYYGISQVGECSNTHFYGNVFADNAGAPVY